MAGGLLNRRNCLVMLAAGASLSCQRGERKNIAVIPKATSHLFWLAVRKGSRDAGEKFNVNILWNGPTSETDYARQIQIVDAMVAQKVDGIVLAATEKTALVAPVDRAVAAGIPVTIFDSGLDGENYTSFVATNNVEAGKLAGRTLAGLIGGKGTVAMVANAPGSASTMGREEGFLSVIKAEFPGIRFVATQFGMSDRAKARGAAENILTAHPRLSGLFASSEPSSIGAALAITSRGLPGVVKLVAFDSSDSILDDLRAGVISATVVQDPHKMGFEAVKTVVDKLEGRTPLKKIDLPARAIRKEDLEKPDVKELLQIR